MKSQRRYWPVCRCFCCSWAGASPSQSPLSWSSQRKCVKTARAMKLLGVQCRGADNTDPSSGLPFCSCTTVTSHGAGSVFWAPWRFMCARTRMYGGLLSSSLKGCTEDPTLHDYPVTSPLCPSIKAEDCGPDGVGSGGREWPSTLSTWSAPPSPRQ